MLGKVLDLPDMKGVKGEAILSLISRLDRAKRADRAGSSVSTPSDVIKQIIGPQSTAGEAKTQAAEVLLDLMPALRTAFIGHVIRRTRDSLDNNGNRISVLPPMTERVLLIPRGPVEEQYIESLKSVEDDMDALGVDWVRGKFGSKASKVRV